MAINNNKKVYYSSLDAWRGYAILWIVLGHFSFFITQDFTSVFSSLLFYMGINLLYPVDIFFIISGFLITRALLEESNSVDLKVFFSRRLLRIIPQYAFLLIIVSIFLWFLPSYNYERITILPSKNMELTFVSRVEDPGALLVIARQANGKMFYFQTNRDNKKLKALKQGEQFVYKAPKEKFVRKIRTRYSNESIVPYLVFASNYTNKYLMVALEHLWFVAAIIQFYIIFSIICLIAYKYIGDHGLRRKVLLLFLVFAMIAISILRVKLGVDSEVQLRMIHLRIDVMFMGSILSLLGYYLNEGALRRHFQLATYFIFITGLLVIVAFMTKQFNIPLSLIPTMSYLAFGAMIMATMSGGNRYLSLMFSNKPVCFLGRHAYGIYLWHYPLFTILYYYLFEYLGLTGGIRGAIMLLLAILIGVCIDILFMKSGYLFKRPKATRI